MEAGHPLPAQPEDVAVLAAGRHVERRDAVQDRHVHLGPGFISTPPQPSRRHVALAPAGHSRSASRCGRRRPTTSPLPKAYPVLRDHQQSTAQLPLEER